MAVNSREAVLAGLARDVELLALVAGNIHHVSAAGPHDTSASYASLQVQMTASIPAALRWSIVPKLRPTDRIELTLVGERGSITWSQETNDESPEPELERRLALSSQEEPLTLPPYDAPLTAIRQLQAAIAQGDARKNAASSTWAKATQAMEIVDAIELSLQKGRTIEVQQQKLTEQLAFRGTMAALGCGLLLLTMLVAFIVGIVGGIESVLRQPVFRIWAPLLLAVLAIFLLLQVVPYLAPQRRDQETDETDNSSE
jgi:hypothetical protein